MIHGSFQVEVADLEGDLFDVDTDAGNILCSDTLEHIEREVWTGKGYVHPDATLRIPVYVNNPLGIKAFGLEFEYDIESMLYLGVQKQSATSDFIALDGTESEPGTLRVGGFGLNPIQMQADTLLFELVFSLSAGQADIQITRLIDDLKDSRIR